MRVVHSGFDTFDVAFQAALKESDLKVLRSARDQANKEQRQILVSLGPDKIPMQISGHGKQGGYAFIGDTGPLGEKWFIKDNIDSRQWNVFVSIGAMTLATYGYLGAKEKLLNKLAALGCERFTESINRADYAIDILHPTFEINLDQIVSHSRTKVRPHWSKDQEESSDTQPSAVFCGRRLETATIGKMPGRQIIIYDKRRAALDQNKFFWFKIWDLDQYDRSQIVWRIEVRTGKNELKQKYRIVSFSDFESSIGDVYLRALTQIRYVADNETDPNVTRRPSHPIWEMATDQLDADLLSYQSGLTPDQMLMLHRNETAENYRRQLLGLSVGYGITLGMDQETMEASLPNDIADAIADHINIDRDHFRKRVERARERLHFLR